MDELVFISSAVSPGADLGLSPRFLLSFSQRDPLKPQPINLRWYSFAN